MTHEVKPASITNNEADLLSLNLIVKRIRRRVVSKVLLKYQFENLKAIPSKILSSFDLEEAPRSSFNLVNTSKVALEEYLKFISLPKHLLHPKDNSNSLLPEPFLLEKIEKIAQKNEKSYLNTYGEGTRTKAFHLYSHVETYPNSANITAEEFYNLELQNSKYQVEVIAVVNHDYPQK
jgi:hypothetical protein